MYRFFISIALCLTISFSLFAQQRKINGIVVSAKNGKALENVTIIIRNKGENTVKSFAYSSAYGTFSIKIPQEGLNSELKFSLMGYAPKIITITKELQNIKITLDEKAIKIKEVAIKAPKIRQHGDTISYLVSSFAGSEDKTIGDVLKKMPGIEVEESGAIKYNGVPINKFYIEGLDLLEGKYGIATKGIPQQDVGQVEVLENHQPIKALEDFTFSENAAINLKLKDASKSKWIGTAQVGLGFSPLLWDVELLGMRFSASSQSMNTYKTNNTGKDIIGETKSFNLEDLLASDDRYTPRDYINLSTSRTSEIDNKRLRFNNTHTLTTTNLWKLGKESELKGQVIYFNNHLNNNSEINSSYFTSEDTLTIIERNTASSQQNNLSLATIITSNTEKNYLKNKLSSDISWNNINSTISGTYPLEQNGFLPNTSIINDFELMRRSKNNVFSISSYNMFFSKKPSLRIYQDGNSTNQDVHNIGLFSNTSIVYSLQFDAFTLSLNGGCSLLKRKIENHLQGEYFPNEISTKSYSSTFSYVHPYINPELEYKNKNMVTKLEFPVHYYNYIYAMNGDKDIKDLCLLSPQLKLQYFATPKISLIVTGNYNDQPLSDKYFYDGIIMQNYQRLQQGFTKFDIEKSQSLSVGIKYKNPIKMLFANAFASRIWSYTPKVSTRSFLDDYILYSFSTTSQNNDAWQFTGRISKGIDLINGLFSTYITYISSESAMSQENEFVPFVSQHFSLKSNISSRIKQWLTTKYEFNYARNGFIVEGTETVLKNYQIQHELEINLIPIKKLRISLLGKYFENQLSDSEIKNLFLMDCGIYYTILSGFEVSLCATNILNESSYAYTVNNDLSSVYANYKLRPRNILASLYFKF